VKVSALALETTEVSANKVAVIETEANLTIAENVTFKGFPPREIDL
jgi:hypothetical protein